MKKLIPLLLVLVMFSGCGVAEKTKVTQLSQLAQATFGVPNGSVADQLVLTKFPNAKFSSYPSTMDCVMALKNGKVDAVAYDEPILKNVAAKNPDLMVLDEPITIDEYAFGVSLENTELKSSIDNCIKELKADGTYEDMNSRWFPKEGEPKPMPEIVLDGTNGILKFGTASITEPFSFRANNKIVGFDIELANRIAKKLGKKLEIVDMEFGAMIPALMAGKVDMIGACITVTEERKKNVLFSNSVYQGGLSAIVRK